ncbi:MAG: hypothetical protein ACI8R4_002868 [Paracoccaceae bacterium]|jgi:hypothetical protein
MANIEYTDDVYTGDLYANAATPEGVYTADGQGAGVDPDPAKTTLGAAMNILGAVASLALIAGVGVWGYKLMVRDVSGVPVVRALQGPMRVQPANPGGQQADHQGLAVNAVAAHGIATPAADRVMLAPRPVTLADEDIPMGQIAPPPASLADDKGDIEGLTAEERAAALDAFQAGSVEALAAQLTAGVAPLSDTVPSDSGGAPETLGQGEDTATADTGPTPTPDQAAQQPVLTGPGLTRSLRPQARPARAVISSVDIDDGSVLAEAISSAVQTVASLDIEADSLPIGTRLAQLGAYDTPDIARGEWDKLNVKFEEVMDNKKRVIQQASSGGRTFYRLRAMGFDDMSDARRFCSVLMAENADCIPVTTR